MYCPHCGTPVDQSPCRICGATFDASDRSPDRQSSTVLAGWWRRVGATVTDNLVLVVPSLFLCAGLNDVAGSVIGATGALAMQGLYLVVLITAPRGRTIGNRLARTQVRDALTGQLPSLHQAVRRWIPLALYGALELTGSPVLSVVVVFLASADYLFPLFDPRKQTLHDKFAGTLVVRED